MTLDNYSLSEIMMTFFGKRFPPTIERDTTNVRMGLFVYNP
jgi:hypothetical protein